jgi:hypothetical protein
LFHYTNDAGFKAIGAQPVWVFKASAPPDPPGHPFGAYFTTLRPDANKLALRLRIPKTKTEFVFCFSGGSELLQLDGGRGEYIYYSKVDYRVEKSRQVDNGPASAVLERLS